MAFIDIQDPKKREETVKDYIKNLNEIRERSENNKVRGLTQRQEIVKVFQPVVKATEKSASQITSEIKNLREVPEVPKSTNQAIDYYKRLYGKSKLDQYFGIKEIDGILMMGEKEVMVDDHNNISIDDGERIFKGTKALWRLIMMKKPENYEQEDFDNYKELLDRTDAINSPLTESETDKPRSTSKWKFFEENGLIEDVQEDEEFEDVAEEFVDKKEGQGVEFLPGNIDGLRRQFHLLFAESRAGNKSSTRNQIVAILDELLRRNYLSQREYNAVCETC